MGEGDGINFQGTEGKFWCDRYNFYLDCGSNLMTIHVCQNWGMVTAGDYTSINLTKKWSENK